MGATAEARASWKGWATKRPVWSKKEAKGLASWTTWGVEESEEGAGSTVMVRR